MKQIINSIRWLPIPAFGHGYYAVSGAEGTWHNTPEESFNVVPIAGTFRNLVCYMAEAHDSMAVTIMVNGVDTALTCTVPAGTESSAQDIVNEISVNAGDSIVIHRGPTTTPADCYLAYSIEFEAAENWYGLSNWISGMGIGSGASGGGLGNGFFSAGWAPSSRSGSYSICSVPGIIDKLAILSTSGLLTGPGIWTAYIILNDVVQDGSGGTVNTACAIGESEELNIVTFSLPIAITDIVEVLVIRTVANSNVAFYNVCVSIGFTPNVANSFMLTGGGTVNVDQALDSYHWNTEPLEVLVQPPRQVPVGPTGFTAQGLYIERGPAVSGVYNHYIRQNNTNTIINAALTTGTTASFVGSVLFADGQFISLLSNPVGTPAGTTRLYWGLAAAISSTPPIPGSIEKSGLYYIEPGKRDDTIWLDATTGLTQARKIP